ncbi:MAG: hypothetical protein IPI58_06270 [Alphaproteobacteria bacterium]|nr:MAG: hypothetical protein IPI58_06270 [Alphaproteobacteria bacterium]
MDWVILSPQQYMTYIACWAVFCLVAVGILVKDRANLRIELSHYRRFLFIPWKLLVFIPAFLFVTFAGRFTDDETWDVMSGGGMSLLTFLTAPWVLGLFYQTLKGWRPKRYMVVAFALCLFSSSWFYDIYLLWRDGEYTSRWFGNLLLSPTIYVAAGLLWNLEVGPNGRVTLSLLRTNWPEPPVNRNFWPLVWVSIPLVLVAVFVLTAYVRWHI